MRRTDRLDRAQSRADSSVSIFAILFLFAILVAVSQDVMSFLGLRVLYLLHLLLEVLPTSEALMREH